MKSDDNLERQGGNGGDQIVRGLNDLAGRIDMETFPGRAWSPATVKRSVGPMIFKIAAAGLAAAAGVMIVVVYWPASVPPVRHDQVFKASAPEAMGRAVPALLVYEDHDSYSVIDLHGSQPIVMFQSKTFRGLPPSIAVLAAPAATTVTTNSHL